MAIPLLNYAPKSQNVRVAGYDVGGDEKPRVYTTENVLSPTDLDDLIEAAYRQIFFHAFKWDREPFLESQLRNGQLSVRDFIRGLLLSKTFYNSFYEKNSNYRFVEQLLNSDEYLQSFGYDTVPYQRRRTLASREIGERPFNITSPRYDGYYRGILGFPQIVWQNAVRRYVPQEQKPKAGDPSSFLAMARGLGSAKGNPVPRVSAMNINIEASVPRR